MTPLILLVLIGFLISYYQKSRWREFQKEFFGRLIVSLGGNSPLSEPNITTSSATL